MAMLAESDEVFAIAQQVRWLPRFALESNAGNKKQYQMHADNGSHKIKRITFRLLFNLVDGDSRKIRPSTASWPRRQTKRRLLSVPEMERCSGGASRRTDMSTTPCRRCCWAKPSKEGRKLSVRTVRARTTSWYSSEASSTVMFPTRSAHVKFPSRHVSLGDRKPSRARWKCGTT